MLTQAVVFDAYGTLFDVDAVEEELNRFFPGLGRDISQQWRRKQLEYTWLRTLMGRYVNFDEITRDALVYTLHKNNLGSNDDLVDQLALLYRKLPAFPEVPSALCSLRPRRLLILSNGTLESLQVVVRRNGLEKDFEAILSVDTVRFYKPSPVVYEMAFKYLSLPKDQIVFVSSNGWDIAGAKSFGFQTAYLNRTGQPPERLDAEPDLVAGDLAELSEMIVKIG